ncbi:hypothetical protein HK405_005732, partial [Cladochytrium tenue]
TSSDAIAALPPCVYLGSRIRPDSVASATAASSTTDGAGASAMVKFSRDVSLWYLERARSLAASDIDDVTTVRVQALLTAQILVTDEDLPAANDDKIINWVEPILPSGQTPVKSPCSETIWTSLDPPKKLLSRRHGSDAAHGRTSGDGGHEQLHVATWIKYVAATATSIAVIVRRLLMADQTVFVHYGPRVMIFSVLEAALSIALADAITTTATPYGNTRARSSPPTSPTFREAMDAFVEFFRRLQDLLPVTRVLYAIARRMNMLDLGFLRRLFAMELRLAEMREQSALWDGLSALSLSHPANVERAAERQMILLVLEAGGGVGPAAGSPAFSPVPAPVPAPAPAPAPMLLASVEWTERMRLVRDYLREVALTTAVIVLTGSPDALPPPPLSKDRPWPAAAALRANKPTDAAATGATAADINDDAKEFLLVTKSYQSDDRYDDDDTIDGSPSVDDATNAGAPSRN